MEVTRKNNKKFSITADPVGSAIVVHTERNIISRTMYRARTLNVTCI